MKDTWLRRRINLYSRKSDLLSSLGATYVNSQLPGTGTIPLTCDGYGVWTKNSNIKTLNWNGGKLRQNTKSGWRHQAGKGLVINGAEVSDNNRTESTSPYYHGIEIDPGIGGIVITSNTFSNDTGSGAQQRAVLIGTGTGDNIVVANNNMSGGYTAATPVYNGPSGINVVVSNNVPV